MPAGLCQANPYAAHHNNEQVLGANLRNGRNRSWSADTQHQFASLLHTLLVCRRDGPDVYVTQDVPLVKALLGTTVTVPTIEGNVELTVPACTQVRS